MKYCFIILILFLSHFQRVEAQKPAAIVPAFTFFTADNKAFTNTQLPGNKMLFFLFFDVTCEHCQQAIRYINKQSKSFDKVALYLITLDEWEKVNLFVNKYGPHLENKSNITILRDTGNEFIKKFGPVKYPSMFLYSAKRKLLVYDDDENGLEKIVRRINGN